jgi:hypothetical protein
MNDVSLALTMGESAIMSAEQTAAQMLYELDSVREPLLLVMAMDEEGTRRPLTVMSWADLAGLAAQETPLMRLAEHLPPLVSLDVTGEALDEDTLLATADALALSPAAPGVLVERDGQAIGVLARNKVAAALSLDLLGKGDARFGVIPDVPTRRYICRKCVPPSYRLPRITGAQAPACRRVWFHGPMEPDGDDS